MAATLDFRIRMTAVYARYPSLENRVVLVTGGASGIGASLVEHFAENNAKVAFLDIETALGEALATKVSAGSKHLPMFLPCDLCDLEALRRAIGRVREHFGPIGVLVNNAANDRRHSIDEVTPASWDFGVAVNLRHQFFAAQAVKDDMRGLGGGSIINLGSVSWMLKQGGMPVYTTSKSAVQGLTRSLARDLGPYRIRVNTIVPGWVMTEKQMRMWVTQEALRKLGDGQCLPDRLQPGDIARMALFLAADDSAMCTAQDFIVDAGWS